MVRSSSSGFVRRSLALALFLILAACGGGGPAPVPEPEPERAAGVLQEAPFQARLDALSLPLTLPEGRAILVNIPSFELIAFEDGVPVLRSRVIVGKPQTRTPRITTYTSAVIFWPSWRPTPEMVASGEVPDRVFPPGPDNPMGVLAIQLEPGLDVFMHDTNQRALFGQPTRAFSHGCIRVERWAALAAWLLERDEASVRAMSAGPVTRRAETGPVPVLIRYFTVFPSEGGGVGVYPDIYGLGGSGTAFSMSTKNRAGCGPPLPKP